MQREVVIIGGGILGVSLAYHLSNLGISNLVVEREASAGQHASGKNAGMFRQLYRHPKLTDWASRSKESWPTALKHKNFNTTGSLIIGRSIPSHQAELFQQESLVRGGREIPAVYTASDGLIDSGSMLEDLRRESKRLGSDYLFQTTAINVEPKGNCWEIRVGRNREKLATAKWAVNCSGAWINQLTLGTQALVTSALPYARHLFLMESNSSNYMPDSRVGFYWDEDAGWYMRRWGTSQCLVSICEKIPTTIPEEYVACPGLSEALASKLVEAIPRIAPELRLVRFWHCFRTYTADQLPIWGEDLRHPGFFWLGAFGGLGMSTSFAATLDSARYIAGLDVDMCSDFRPERTLCQ